MVIFTHSFLYLLGTKQEKDWDEVLILEHEEI